MLLCAAAWGPKAAEPKDVAKLSDFVTRHQLTACCFKAVFVCTAFVFCGDECKRARSPYTDQALVLGAVSAVII